jgi:DNA-binding MarR family transcriptional regulator
MNEIRVENCAMAIDKKGATPRLDRRDSPLSMQASGPQEFISYRINLIYRLLDRQTKNMLGPRFGYTSAQWRLLSNLARHSPDTVSGLAERTLIPKSQISLALRELVVRGHALRIENRCDGRQPKFQITPKGRTLYIKIMGESLERQGELIAQIPRGEREIFSTCLDRLLQYLGRDGKFQK